MATKPRGGNIAGAGDPKGNAQAAKKKPRRWLRRLGLGALWTFLLLIIAGCGGFLFAYATIEIPKPDQVAKAQTTTVYYKDGTTVMGTFSDLNRTIVDTTSLPNYIGRAVVASEDRTFFSNNGVDLKGIVRAFINNLQGKPRQGASTLSQQYVERYYVGKTTGYVGKAKEAILALKINREQPKAIILDNYLNTIYFGRGAYGIEAASKAYFGKPAAKMTLAEAAMISGIIPAPSKWDPALNEKMAKERWERVLHRMTEDGWITAEEKAKQKFPATIAPVKSNSLQGTNGYLMQHVRSELSKKLEFSGDEIDQAGLKIVTTIDPKIQADAVKAAQSLPEDAPANLRVAIVAIDPATGAIRAEYGGKDYLKVQRNAATQDVAQAGSTFKAFTLAAALEDGKSMTDTFPGNSPLKIPGGGTIRNFGNSSYGEQITLLRATENSVNTAFVALNKEIGPDKTKQAAEAAGIPANTKGLSTNLANVLGSASPHTVDLAGSFATFASGGIHRTPHIVSQVLNAQGGVLHRAETKGKRVFKAENMASLAAALSQVVESGTAKEARQLRRPVAGKTGSSTDNKSAQFAGFVPQLATAVSLYQVGPKGEEESITPFGGQRQITGGTFPVKIFTKFMKPALEGMPKEDFPKPPKPIFAPEPTVETPTPTPSNIPTPTPTPTQPSIPAIPEPTERPEDPDRPPRPRPTKTPKPPRPTRPTDPPEPTEDAHPNLVFGWSQ